MRSVCWILPLLMSIAACSRPVQEVSYDPSADSFPELEPVKVDSGDWPWWRGTARNAHAQSEKAPTSWLQTKGENVVWAVDVPGRGHASPVLWGERVFVASADEAAGKQMLLCYDRRSGERQWEVVLHEGGLPSIHRKNSHASSTPACDGKRVFTVFANRGGVQVSAVDLEGSILWQKQAGPFRAQHGYGSSPVIYGSTVIVNGDNSGGSFLAALHRESGEIVWRTKRPGGGSYATPIVLEAAGRDQLLMSGQHRVAAFDPQTGERIWHCRGPAEVTANTMSASGDYVIASGGYGGQAVMCIRADGEGEVSDSHIVWEYGNKAYVPSPLVAEGLVFVVRDNGTAVCLEVESGDVLWQERLGGDFSASPILVGDVIYATNENGMTFMFKADREFELIGKNGLGNHRVFASPVVCNGRLYLRSEQRLFCFESKTDAKPAATEVSQR